MIGHRVFLLLAAITALLPVSRGADAATFCVSNGTELQNALTTAATNGENDVVKIKKGNYSSASGTYAFAYSTSQNNSINVSGGWYDLFNVDDCLLNLQNPTDTVLSGTGARQVLLMNGGAGHNGAMTLSNLSIVLGVSTSDSGGLDMGGPATFTGNVLVDRVFFDTNVAATFAGGGRIGSDGGTVTVRNSRFRNNLCGSNDCAAELVTNFADKVNVRALFINNTVVDNSCSVGAPVTCDTGGVRMGGSARQAAVNNAFFGNGGVDLRIQATVDVFNNNLPSLGGITPNDIGGNVDFADPGFVAPGTSNYRLKPTSPLINAGTFLHGSPGGLDLDGNPRFDDGQYDIGAYEFQNDIFEDGFEPAIE